MPALPRLALILALLATPLATFPVRAQNTQAAKPAPITDAKGWYMALRKQVGINTVYPNVPRPPVKEGETPPLLPPVQVTVRFVLDRDGRVLAANVERNSGSSEYGEAALETLKRAAPFPKPPAMVTGDRTTLVLPIHYVDSPRAKPKAKAKLKAKPKPQANPAATPPAAVPPAAN